MEKPSKRKCEWPAFSDVPPPLAGCRWSVWHEVKSPGTGGTARFDSTRFAAVLFCFADPLRGRGEGGDNGELAINLFLELSVCQHPRGVSGGRGETTLPVKLALDHLTRWRN